MLCCIKVAQIYPLHRRRQLFPDSFSKNIRLLCATCRKMGKKIDV